MPRTQRRVGLLDNLARCAPVPARGRGVGKDQPRAPQVGRSHVELLCFEAEVSHHHKLERALQALDERSAA